MAWFYTILICFLPGTIFFNSYVNMDALGLCASSWIVLCWCKVVKKRLEREALCGAGSSDFSLRAVVL